MRRVIAVASLGLAVTAGSAAAFTRTESTSGACLAWPGRRVEFAANADGLPGQQPVCAPGAALDRLSAALDAWTRAAAPDGGPCTDIQLAVVASTSSTEIGAGGPGAGENLVVWRRGRCGAIAPADDPCWSPLSATSCAAKYDCWEYDDRTIALTTTSYLVSTGEIVDADVELNGWDGGAAAYGGGGRGWYFTCYDPVGASVAACDSYGQADCVGMDLEGVLAHELGHAIGIADQYTSRSGTMYGYADNGDTSKRTLAPDDVDAVCSVYPAGASTPTCGSTATPPGTRLGSGAASGCASGGIPGLAGAFLALVALRRTKRPRSSSRGAGGRA